MKVKSLYHLLSQILILLITAFDGISDAWVYKTHTNFSRSNQEKNKVQILNVMKFIYINILMYIINDNTFSLNNYLLNNHNRYMKVTLKSKLIGVSR